MINEGWAFVCLVGLWGWILATICFILKSFPAKGVFRAKLALLWGCVIFVCYIAWFAGMINT